MASSRLVHSVAVLDFDISVGDTVRAKWPADAKLPLSDDELSARCIPEGGHLFEEDWTFLILHEPALYGLAYFSNKKDATVKRGAVMMSIVILSSRPYFAFFLPLCRATLHEYQRKPGTAPLRRLVDALNHLSKESSVHLQLFDGTPAVPVEMPTLGADQFAGASLLKLVRRFRQDTMLLWLSLLLHHRVLFFGQPAHEVGNCVLAAPLLAAPLTGFAAVLSPYVPLSHPAAVEGAAEGARYVCGVTNALFEHKSQWHDAIGVLSSGVVSCRPELKLRVGPKERAFIRNVLSGVERDARGEAWVREQFRLHTQAVLGELRLERLPPHRKQLAPLIERPAFTEYTARATAAAADAVGAPRATLAALESYLLIADGGARLTAAERSKLLFNVQSALVNLEDVDALVEAGAVELLSSPPFLASESANVRKYAVSVLALLATSLKGQVAMLCGGAAAASDAVAAADGGAGLDRVAAANADAGGGGGAMMRVAALLRDGMPAVVAMAASCLHKVSTLVIGAQAIVSAGLHTGLAALLLAPPSDDLLLRTHLASTLLQVYRLCPRAPRPKGVEASVTKLLSALSDRELALILLQLLDAWGVALAADALPYEVRTMAQISSHLTALAAADAEAAAAATALLQAELVAHRWLTIPLVLSGVCEALDANEAKAHSAKKRYADARLNLESERLARLSVSALALVADTSCGARRLAALGLPARMAARLAASVAAPAAESPARAAPARRRSADADGYTFQVGRLLEVLAQHDDSARALLSAGATAEIVGFVGSHARAPRTAPLCGPVVGCLRHLLLTLPALRDGVAYTEARAPLKQLCDLGPTGDKKLDDGIGAVLALVGLERGAAAASAKGVDEKPVFTSVGRSSLVFAGAPSAAE